VEATVYMPQVEITNEATYWDALGQLPAAMAHLVWHRDSAPYIAYWIARTKGTVPQARARAAHMQTVADDIQQRGFDLDHWRTDLRGFDPVAHGFGPIVVTRAGSIIYPRDGSHRASILKALDRRVYAYVWRTA
jgi:hypothetical protein